MFTMDAGGIAHYVSQTAFIENTVYETKYGNIFYDQIIPVDMSIPEFVNSASYFAYDSVGISKFIGANAKDLPQVDLSGKMVTYNLFYGGSEFGWSLDELRVSKEMKMPLDIVKPKMSRRSFEEHAQRVALNGDADRAITGLFNNANVQTLSSTLDYATATGEEMLIDLDKPLSTIWENSKEVSIANTMLIPSTIYKAISKKIINSVTGETVLERFKKNNFSTLMGVALSIRPILQLNLIGASSHGRIIAYEKNPENLTMPMAIMWRMLPQQATGLRLSVPAEYKFGGVEIRYPGAFAYVDLA